MEKTVADGWEIVERIIDITNAMNTTEDGQHVLGDEASQRKNIETWIAERGMEQYEATKLTLLEWSF